MIKKIVALVLFLVLGKLSYSQYPLQQNLGNDSTIVISRGALQSRLIPIVISDTNAANAQRLKSYPGAQLYTTNGNFYIRNSNATKWILVSGGSSGPLNIYNSDGTLTGNRILTGANNNLTFTGLNKFSVNTNDSVLFNTPNFNIKNLVGDLSVEGTVTGGSSSLTLKTPEDGDWTIKTGRVGLELGDLRFYDNVNGGGDARMIIKNNGKVGIGTEFPDSMLTVTNGAYFQRGVRMSGLPQAPGIKQIRIDANGRLSVADTSISVGTVTSVATNDGTGIKGGTITTSGTLYIDTTIISTKANVSGGLAGKLNISDTASMLSPYVNNVGYALGKTGQTIYADSATLSAYYLRRKDSLTATNSLGYVTKQVLADTAAAIRGADAGGTVTSVATNNGTGITGGTITTTGTLAIDTTVISTRAWRQKGIDSVASLPKVTSVGLTMPTAFNVANSPITSSGTIAVTGAGTAAQYIRGDGQLATFPATGAGGSAIYYYLNGSVNSSVVGYQQMANSAIIGAGTDFTLTGNGLIAQFLTDSANPNRVLIPGGSWNTEMFFSVSSTGGNQKFYLELLKYDGTTFTPIASSILNPEEITGGTSTDLYLTSIAVPQTTLLTTDRLAIRVYIVDNAVGRTVTLHTENSNLCQITTTFAGGISSLNGLTANTQYLATGTSGTDFNISSLTDTHTFNLPVASATNTGKLSNTDWSTFNNKVNISDTASMLTPYLRNVGYGLARTSQTVYADSSVLSNYYLRRKDSLTATNLLGYVTRKVLADTAAAIRSADAGGTVTSVATNNGTGITGGTITTSGTLAIDTLLVSTRAWRQKGIDSVQANLTAGLATKLNISDTAAMLSPYARTNVVNAALATKLNISDTASMLNPYLRKVDTTAMLSPYKTFYPRTAISLTTTGSSGAATYNNSTGVLNIPVYTDAFTGTVTSVATNNGTGITGGTITTSGTLAIDTLLVSTRAWRQKGIDSVTSLINARVSGTTNYIPKFTSSSAIGNSVIYESGGNIGIGTTSPDSKLHVLDAAGNSIRVGFLSGSANFNLYDASVHVFRNEGGSSERMRLDASGNLGLGTSSPNSKMEILRTSAGSITSQLLLHNGSDNDGTGARLDFSGLVDGSIATGSLANVRDGAGLYSLRFYTFGAGSANNERMRLDASGNLGLGVTPSAWSVVAPGFQVKSASISSYGDGFNLGANWFYNGSTDRYINTGYATLFQGYQGEFRWYTAPSGTAGNAISFTQAMTLDASGRLGIGTTSPQTALTISKANVGYAGQLQIAANDYAQITFYNSSALTPSAANRKASLIYNVAGNTFEVANQISGGSLVLQGGDSGGGNVLIGTDTNAGYKLDVSGGDLRVSSSSNTRLVLNNTSVNGKNYSIYSADAGNLIIGRTGIADYVTLTDGGNLGLGVTPSAWSSTVLGLQVRNASIGGTSTQAFFGQGYYYNSGWKYIGTGSSVGQYYIADDGSHQWLNAPSGTAGSAISFTQAMTLDASGRLGIGSTAPDAKLLVYGTASRNMFGVATTDLPTSGDEEGVAVIKTNSALWQLSTVGYLASSKGVRFYNNGGAGYTAFEVVQNAGTRFIVDGIGNVGIGTTSPAALFDVTVNNAKTVTAGVYAYLGKTNEVSNYAALQLLQTGAAVAANRTWSFQTIEQGIANAGNISFQPNGGNVGIGTTSPTNKLAIETSSANGGYDLNFSGSTFGRFGIVNPGTSNDTYIGAVSNNNFLFYSNNSERMRITSGGNILMGTTTDAGNRLQVQGVIGVNTSGQTRTISTYYVAGSGGENIWIGGGGGSSTGTGAQGSYNSAMGVNALLNNTTGYLNSAMGQAALYYNTTGYYNSAMGQSALYSNTTGYYNSAMGVAALYSNTTGFYNSAIGMGAGRYTNAGGANETSNNSVYLGYDTRASASGNTNEIVIGSEARGNGSNSATLGNSSISKTILYGNVGIGTTSPQRTLDVIGSSNDVPAASFGRGLSIGNWSGIGFGYVEAGNSNYRKAALVFERTGGAAEGKIHILNNNTADISSASLADARLTITPSGNVGIGTTSPTTLSGYTSLAINGTNGGITYYGVNGTDVGRILSNGTSLYFDNVSTGDLIYRTSANTERMRITSGGNVGIGTSTINGTGTILAVYNATDAQLRLQSASTGQGSSDGVLLSLASDNSMYVWNYEAQPMIFGTSAAEQMRITSGGNVLIGTTVDNGNALQVNGAITTSATALMNGSGAWRLGIALTPAGGGLTLNTTKYIEVSVDGTIYKLALVN